MGWDVTERFGEEEEEDNLTLIDPTADAERIDDLDTFLSTNRPAYFEEMERLWGKLWPEAPHLRHEVIVGGWNRWSCIRPLSLKEEKEVMMDKAID